MSIEHSRSDVPEIAQALTAAFFEDPVASYIFSDQARRAEMLWQFFVLQLRHNYLPRGEVYTTVSCDAAALWMPPDVLPTRFSDWLAHVVAFSRHTTRFLVMQRVATRLSAHRPKARHYYLGTLGTNPRVQRQGYASALLDPVLNRCDDDRCGAYLESSRSDNVEFYEHHGFTVIDKVAIGPDGPPIWLMWRESASGEPAM